MLNSSALIDETLRFATESPSGVEVMAREGGAMLRVLVWPVLLYMLVNFLWTQYNMRGVPADFNLPPGSFGLPLIGETIQFVANGRQFARSRLQSAGSAIFRTNLLLSPCVVVSGADNVRQVLFGEGRTVQHVGPPTGRVLFGPGALSNSSGETLQRHKKFIAKAFAFQELSAYTGAIHDVIRRQLTTWCAEGGVKGVSECRRLTFMVTAHVLLGMRIDESDVGHIAQLFETFMTSFFAFPVALPGTAFSKGLEARKQLLVILRRYVDGAEEGSLLRRLADDINDIDVTCDICLEMLFGSYLTVASASCSTLLQLANNENVRAKLREELSSLELGASSNGDSGKTLSWNDVSSLQYTSSVVKEVFRFMPPIAGGFRKTLQPFKLNGYDIPAGWLILYSIADTHETSSQVTDPMTFRPERWATSECCKSQSCDASSSSTGDNLGNQRSDYLPFGAGARKCVGQEFAKLVLKVFIAELTSSYDCDIKDLQPPMITAPVPFPANGLPLTLKRRCSDSSMKSSRTVKKSNGF